MKNLLLLAAFQCAACLAGTLKGQSATNEQAMRVFDRDFMVAYNRQDADALKAMYTTDALALAWNGDSTRGADRIAQRFEDRFIRNDATLLVRQIDVTWSDAQHALVTTGTYESYGITVVYDIPYSRKTAYRNTMVQENSQWKIARSEETPLVKTFAYQKKGDPAEWNSALADALNRSGVLTIEIGRPHGDPGAVYALLEWPSLAAAQAFFESPEWQKTLGQTGKGKKPLVSYLKGG